MEVEEERVKGGKRTRRREGKARGCSRWRSYRKR